MIVYKITNLLNGKLYIGQTINGIADRWRGHLRSDSKSVISKAIRKYGPENFKIEHLESVASLEELNKKEAFYISYYKTISPHGYNLLSGGDGTGKHHPTTIEKLSKKMMGRIVSRQHRELIAMIHSVPICQYLLDGTFVKRWDSAMSASRELNIGNSELNKCCKGHRRQSGGFQWKYEHYEKIDPVRPRLKQKTKIQPNARRKAVAMVDTHGVILETYESATEAALKNNCDHSSICKVCNKKLAHIKNMLFVFLENSR